MKNFLFSFIGASIIFFFGVCSVIAVGLGDCQNNAGAIMATAQVCVGDCPTVGSFTFDWEQVDLTCPAGQKALSIAQNSMTNRRGEAATSPELRMKLVAAGVAHLCLSGTHYAHAGRNTFSILDNGGLPPLRTDCSGYVGWIYFNAFYSVTDCGITTSKNFGCPLCNSTNRYVTVGQNSSYKGYRDYLVNQGILTRLTSADELLPGDIIVNAENSHVLMFVGWDNRQRMVLHCTGDPNCSQLRGRSDPNFYRLTNQKCLNGLGLTSY